MPQLDLLMYKNTVFSILIFMLIFFFEFWLIGSILFNFVLMINFYKNRLSINPISRLMYLVLSAVPSVEGEGCVDCKTAAVGKNVDFADLSALDSFLFGSKEWISESVYTFGLFYIDVVQKTVHVDLTKYPGLEEFGLVKVGTPISEIITHSNNLGIPDKPTNMIGFQNPGSMDMAAVICIHNDIYYYLQTVLVIVIWFLFFSIISNTIWLLPTSSENLKILKNKIGVKSEGFDSCTLLEIIWTIFPSVCLLFIGYPGISLLYSIDEQVNSDFFIKVIGHQWYWTYEYPEISYDDNRCFKYDSVLRDWNYYNIEVKQSENFGSKNLAALKLFNEHPEKVKRYIYVNAPLYILYNTPITAIVTSSDVLHSWAVPSLGIKIDACPGRLNQIQFTSNFKSADSEYFGDTYYWGQCSEFCGVGHGFMPILIRSSHLYDYFPNIIEEFKAHKVRSYSKGMFGPYPTFLRKYFDSYPAFLRKYF